MRNRLFFMQLKERKKNWKMPKIAFGAIWRRGSRCSGILQNCRVTSWKTLHNIKWGNDKVVQKSNDISTSPAKRPQSDIPSQWMSKALPLIPLIYLLWSTLTCLLAASTVIEYLQLLICNWLSAFMSNASESKIVSVTKSAEKCKFCNEILCFRWRKNLHSF